MATCRDCGNDEAADLELAAAHDDRDGDDVLDGFGILEADLELCQLLPWNFTGDRVSRGGSPSRRGIPAWPLAVGQ